MGTRNLVCVVAGGEYKVAQYGQWDGYPSGQGAVALDFLRTVFDREKFLARLAACFAPTDAQVKQWWTNVGHDTDTSGGLVDASIAQRFDANHPSLSRDTGARILRIIQDSIDPVPLHLATGFAADSLFCEYAYVIDLDKGTFEVFKGFNEQPLATTERFYGWKEKFPDVDASDEYHPVRFVASFDLAALPTEEAFRAACEPSEEVDG